MLKIRRAHRRFLIVGCLAMAIQSGCAKTKVGGTLDGKPFVGISAFAESDAEEIVLYVTAKAGDILQHKSFDEGEPIVWLFLPSKTVAGDHRCGNEQAKNAPRTAYWRASWKSPGDGSDLVYGKCSITIHEKTDTKIILQFSSDFGAHGAVKGKVVATLR